MSIISIRAPARRRGLTSRRMLHRGRVVLITGTLIALLTDGVASTILSLARSEINGQLSTTPDEFAWLTIVYLTAKVTGFLVTPWVCGKAGARATLISGVSLMVILFCLSTLSDLWSVQLIIFTGLGLAGGAMLVSAQSLFFQTFSRQAQPGLQLLYAMASSAGSAALAPGMQGFLLDSFDWRWIVVCAAGAGVLSLAFLHATRTGARAVSAVVSFDGQLIVLIIAAAGCLAYVSTQGERWNWFSESRIIVCAVAGGIFSLMAALRAMGQPPHRRMLDMSIYLNLNFSFAFLANFVAGFALFGTAYLIPAYATGGLGMNSHQTGILLLPGAAGFVLAMLSAVYLLPRLRIPAVLTVPAGIIFLMIATWLLGHQSRGAGVWDLLPAVLLRGGGLGFLFLAITLLALMWMPGTKIPHGVALMCAARQIGGLAGTGFLGAVLSQQTALNSQMLSAHLTSGEAVLDGRLNDLTARFVQNGLSVADASSIAVGQIARQLNEQAAAVAWSRTFLTVTIFFCLAAPALVISRFVLLRVLGLPPAPPTRSLKK